MFDDVIYLHGSTCADGTAMVMTFAHELQHFVQHGLHWELWAANFLFSHLPKDLLDSERVRSFDIEREARAVAKRTAVRLCGASAVEQYIERRVESAADAADMDDWRFIQSMDPSLPYDGASKTRRMYVRMLPYRHHLERFLRMMSGEDDKFKRVNLSAYYA